MKIFLKYSAAIILMIGGSHKAIAADPLVLSREQCVEIALRDNPTVRIADMEVKNTTTPRKKCSPRCSLQSISLQPISVR